MYGEMNVYVELLSSGCVLGTEGFDTIEEAREYIRRELLPILEGGDTVRILEN